MSTIEQTFADEDDHPYLGEVDPETYWAEAQQWNLVDAGGNGLIYHLATMPRQLHLRHNVVGITLADGTILSTKVVGPSSHPEQFGVDFLHSRTIEPFRKWELHMDCGMQYVDPAVSARGLLTDGPHVAVHVDLQLEAAHPLWIPGPRASDGEGARVEDLFSQDYVFHHEQAFYASGTITIEGREIAIEGAVGHRDHSRGIRTAVYDPHTDMHKIQNGAWLNGLFESGWGFATMDGLFSPDGRYERAAIFTDAGVEEAVVMSSSELASATGAPREFEVVLDVSGDRRVIKVRTTHGVNFTGVGPSEWCLGADHTNPNSHVWAMYFAEFECDGEKGRGFVDRSARAKYLTAPG